MSQSIRSFSEFATREGSLLRGRVLRRPTRREWVRHTALFLLTALTATLAGTVLLSGNELPETPVPALTTPLDYLLFIPFYYLSALETLLAFALGHPAAILSGATFAGSLLFILLAHESGHYIACRIYGVDATLPFFIPVPPPFIAGTLGAFIKIRSPIPSRRALFDIGVAGPLAGFAALLPVAALALWTARPDPQPLASEGVIIFNDPLLLRLLAPIFRVEDLGHIVPNPFYFAAWIGLLVTSLNLMPVGQLDGGHATYALAGARAHRRIGLAAFLAMATLAPLGWLWHGAPSGIVYAALLFIMLRLRHPQAEDERDPLGRTRLIVALITLAVFLLSFQAFPLTVL